MTNILLAIITAIMLFFFSGCVAFINAFDNKPKQLSVDSCDTSQIVPGRTSFSHCPKPEQKHRCEYYNSRDMVSRCYRGEFGNNSVDHSVKGDCEYSNAIIRNRPGHKPADLLKC